MFFHKKISAVLFLLAVLLFPLLTAGNIRAEDHKVSMQNWLFTPKELTINVGDRVTWINDDDTVHALYFEDALPGFPEKENTHIIKVGKEFSLIFEKKGKYNYFCKRHRDFDMIGSITVK